MSASLRASSAETPQQKLSGIRATDNKTAAHPKETESELRLVAKEAMQRVGKQAAAASDIGISEGRLSAKLGDGTLSLGELEKLGPQYAAEFGRQLLERFGPLATPHARAAHLLREMRRMHEELSQLIDYFGERTA